MSPKPSKPKKPAKKLFQLDELPEISNPFLFVGIVTYRTHKPVKVYYTRNHEALDKFVILERATDETIQSIDLAIIMKTILGVEVA